MRHVDACPSLIAAVAAIAVTLTASPAKADDAVGLDWIAGEPGVEIAVSAAALLSHTSGFIGQRQSTWGPSWRRPRDDAYGLASDFTGSVLGAGWQSVVLYALDVEYFSRHDVADPAAQAGRTTIVDMQSLVLATGISIAIKKLTGRCRPRAFYTSGCREHDGFPSGHTVMPSALAGSRFMLALRTEDAPERWGAFGLVESMALTTAALRMLAGAHSWDDVLAGWLIGHATGTLLSLAHPTVRVPSEPGAPGEPVAPASSPFRFVWSSRF